MRALLASTAATLLLLPAGARAQASTAPPAAEAEASSEEPLRLRVHGEVRTRGEVLRNLDLDPDLLQTGSAWGDGERVLLRTRLGVEGIPSDHLVLYVQVQDSRLFGAEPTTASATIPTVLHQGWAELRQPGDLPLELRLGRMELSYGDQRLIGAFGWDNVGRVFDGARLRLGLDEVTVDAFWTRLHVDPWGGGTRAIGDDFGGLYGMWRPGDALQVDAYVLALYDRGGLDDEGVARMPGGGELLVWTPGVRVDARPVEGLHLNGELALQFGERGDQDVQAWAVHLAATQTLPVALAPWISVGFDAASGDADPDDDTWGTFENLFPTNHDKYGLIDLASWKNLRDWWFGVGARPVQKLALNATVHLLARGETADTFYRANGAPLRSLEAARSTDAKRVGTELDLTATWAFSEHFSVLLGYSHLFAGDFLDETAGNGEAPDPAFGYLQLTASF